MVPPRGPRIVLLGAAHAHVSVIGAWSAEPLAGCSLTCVSEFPTAADSGAMPVVMAGLRPPAAIEVDLHRLCAAAGISLQVGEVVEIDFPRRQLVMFDSKPVPFDILSIGLAAAPSFGKTTIDATPAVVPIAPTQTVLTRLRSALTLAAEARDGAPLPLVVVGGGRAGVETALAAQAFKRVVLRDALFQSTLVSDTEVLPGWSEHTRHRAQRALERAGVQLMTGHRPVRAEDGALYLDDETCLPADVILWAMTDAPAALVATIDLPKDPQGFLLRSEHLQSTSGDSVFVVGGAAGAPSEAIDPLGEGHTLWDNLRRLIARRALRRFCPKRPAVRVIRTFDGRGISEWRGLSVDGRWCARLRDRCDRALVGPYQALAGTSRA